MTKDSYCKLERVETDIYEGCPEPEPLAGQSEGGGRGLWYWVLGWWMEMSMRKSHPKK